MSNLLGRKVELIAGNKTFDADEFGIYFDVPFSDSAEPNVALIEIYNLKETTTNELKKGLKVILNAGYKNDVGSIFLGEIQLQETNWQRVDKRTTLTAMDSGEKWFKTPVKRTYKAGIKGKQILVDLLARTGLETGALDVTVNKTYKGGKTVNTTLSKAIEEIAKDCGVKMHINKGKIYIRPKNAGDNIKFLLDAAHGLISSPTPIEKEVVSGKDEKGQPITKTVNGWNVVTLLNHRISTDALIEITSKTANGLFRVESGKHYFGGSSFYTEMEVYPL